MKKLAKVLNVPITSFFEDDEEKVLEEKYGIPQETIKVIQVIMQLPEEERMDIWDLMECWVDIKLKKEKKKKE